MVDFLCMFYPVCERPDGYKVADKLIILKTYTDAYLASMILLIIIGRGKGLDSNRVVAPNPFPLPHSPIIIYDSATSI